MATFEESFLYPLYLLLIGAGVSGVAVAFLSHLLENHRKKRESRWRIRGKDWKLRWT
jgi:hypothetical protein